MTGRINELTEENALLLRQERIWAGSGCVLVQTVLRYNTPQVTANKGLSLRARAVTNTNRLEVCLAYTEARPNTGMVLVEVELLTGWRAVSPERLTNQVEALVQN